MTRDLRFELVIRAPARSLWALLTHPTSIPRWWDRVYRVEPDGPWSVGRTYRLLYEGGTPDTVEILERDEPHRLVFRWTSSEPAPTIVEYALTERQGETVLAFRNSGYGHGGAWDSSHDANFVGWLNMLLGVRRLLEADASESGPSALVYAYPPAPRWTAELLAAESEKAHAAIGIHGVTAHATSLPGRPRVAERGALLSAGFAVHATPLNGLSDHLTIEVPRPVTDSVARALNRVLGMGDGD
jgi:uncharacterized protein YndB with AHSA1/START domain